MINVRRDIRWTRCVPLNETTFHFEEIAMLNAISRTATTYHAAYARLCSPSLKALERYQKLFSYLGATETYNAIAKYIRPARKVLNAIRLRGVFDFLYLFTWNMMMRY
jgi:hypothetical protein